LLSARRAALTWADRLALAGAGDPARAEPGLKASRPRTTAADMLIAAVVSQRIAAGISSFAAVVTPTAVVAVRPFMRIRQASVTPHWLAWIGSGASIRDQSHDHGPFERSTFRP
jgi:hypothetical protein